MGILKFILNSSSRKDKAKQIINGCTNCGSGMIPQDTKVLKCARGCTKVKISYKTGQEISKQLQNSKKGV